MDYEANKKLFNVYYFNKPWADLLMGNQGSGNLWRQQQLYHLLHLKGFL